MSQDWIISVLQDLRSFAQKNGYPLLAEQIDDTIHVAVAELSATPRVVVEPNANTDTSVPGTRGAVQ